MRPVHVEPDSLHLASRALLQDHYHLADRLFALRMSLYRLEMAWQGGDAEEYLGDLNLLLEHMRSRLDELLTLSLTLSRQAEAWEECDQRWSGVFREGA